MLKKVLRIKQTHYGQRNKNNNNNINIINPNSRNEPSGVGGQEGRPLCKIAAIFVSFRPDDVHGFLCTTS